MAKTYTLTSTASKGGTNASWTSGVWSNYYFDNNNGETRRCGQVLSGGSYCATYYMFDTTTLASLKTKTITSVKLTISVTGGTGIPGSGTELYVVREKVYNTTGSGSSSNAWVGDSNVLSYVVRETGSSSTFDLTLPNTIPTYGYVLGPYAAGYGRYLILSSTATLTVVTNENDYSYTLAYDANGGSGAPSNQTGSSTGTSPSYTFTISNTIPTRTGYDFLGWSKSSTATSASYSAGGSITVTSSGKTTLYAVWKIKTYTVSYKKGSNGTGTNTTATKTYGVALTLKGAIFTRTGYTQTGWSTSDGGSKTYNLSASYTTNASVTLYPFWTIDTYSVSYDANGGTGAPSAQTKTYGQTLVLSSTKPARGSASAGSYTVTYKANYTGGSNPSADTAAKITLYSFIKWNTAKGGGGTSYSPGDDYTANSSATLYAQWKEKTSTADVILPSPTRTGYTFTGWYTASSGGSKVGDGGDPYTPSADITLYAQWSANVVAPTFTTQPSAKSVYRGGTASLSVVATTTQGTITYRWQSSTDNSSFSNISGATSSTYSAPTSTVGTIYYRCVATATKDGVSKSTNSNSVSVAVSATPTPTISTQPSNKSVYVGGTASLSVAGSTASGTLSYQWYSSADNSSFTAISGATSNTYSAPTSAPGTNYYRARVTNTLNGYTKYKDSSSASVTVSVAAPTISTQPSKKSVYKGGTATLTVSATAPNGTISYQWQSSSDNSSFSNISGATSSSYSAPTSSTGTKYYRCVLKATYSGATSKSTTSNSVSVAVSATPVPTISTQPSNKNVDVGGTASLSVSATVASGTLSYQWYSSADNSSFTAISGATSNTYSAPTSTAGTKYYKVRITNTLNGYTAYTDSNSVSVNVGVAAPTITTQPSNKSVYRGASATLSVAATAPYGTLSYQWQKSTDNSSFSNISGATSTSYSASTATVGTVYYRCLVKATKDGVFGSAYSSSAYVTVNATPAPKITTQPLSKSVGYNETAKVGTAATGNSISYQWQSSSDNSTWSNISGATSATYTAPTNAYGTIYYRCVVKNTLNGYTSSVNSASASVKVSITPPTFSTQPSGGTVYRGATKTLSAVATAPYGTITYQWQSSSNNSTWSNISGATSSSYTAPTSTVGTKYYRCVATTTHLSIAASTNSDSVSLKVSATPTPNITANPSSKSVFTGSTGGTISVTATGNSLSYQWQSSSDNSSFSNISGATSSSYAYPTSSAGTNYYRCVVTNTLYGYTANATSSSASVIVSDVTTPVFTANPQSASYAIGATTKKLSVSATSNGTITYQWQKSTNNSTWSNISGATSQNYTPSSASAGVLYYRCVATATGGSQTKTKNSTSASITIIAASSPIFTYDLSQVDVTYNAGDVSKVLNGVATATNGTITYQWYKSTDEGSTWYPISGAQSSTYRPPTTEGGQAYYRVVATNIVGTSSASSTSGAAKVTIQNVILSYDEKWSQYINSVGKPFVKLARLDFLNPNGSVLYTLDNNPRNSKSGAFIQAGELTVNLQNGMRRTATVTLSNLDGEFDYNVNKLWFGQQVRLWEGMVLPSGADFYISQGVFYVKDPDEVYEPGLKQTTLNLVDKWAYLDGTLFGNLDGTYEIPLNSNIFNAIQSILNLDRGNGQKVDSSVPIFTNYYNGRTTTLPDGSTVPLTNTPYTYRCDSENGTYADIILELNTMLAGWIGYDANGQLRLDPSQDDIVDTTKPIQWQFSPTNSTFLGATYSVKNSEVYNDIIIVGESLSEYGQTSGRATNYDPRSDTNANIIGLKTKRYQQSGYYTKDICESLAVFKLKRESVLKKSVSIKCSQMFHLQENNLVTIERTDKYGNPIERHLITGYTRPIAQNGDMVLNCTAVADFPTATVTTAP